MSVKKYSTKKGPRFSFTTFLGHDDLTNKKIIITRGGFKTKREAENAEAKARLNFDRGKHKESQESYQEIYNAWFPLYAKTVKESTLNKTLGYFNIHILPFFSDTLISKLHPTQCQNFANALSKKFKDYKKVYSYASRIYDYAYKIGITDKPNPFERVVFPKNDTRAKETAFLEKDQLLALLDSMKGHPLWHTYFTLLAFTGMRKGEALALDWSDIDFKKHTASVSKTVTTGLENEAYISSTKTSAGMRVIDLDPGTLNVLKEYRGRNGIVRMSGRIFTTRNGGLISLSKPYAFLKCRVKELGLPDITVHSLRHTHCSMLFEAGWSIKDVQQRLGHRDVKTTMNIYAHVSQARKKEAMKDFINYMQA